MTIKKAVITAAGYGTRFFPITKTISKEMLPVLDRPVIDYLVDDAIAAGIEEIIFVVKPEDDQIRGYYSENRDVYKYLERMGKLEKYEKIADLHTKAKFTYVEQGPNDPYGTAIPLRLVEELVNNEDAFMMLMGDDILFNDDRSSEAANMIEHFVKSKADALAAFQEKPESDLSKYGIAKLKQQGEFDLLEEIVEKPAPGSAPSNLVNLTKYIFTPAIFEALAKQTINQTHNEWFITDTVTIFAENYDVVAYTSKANHLDCGFMEGWLNTNNFMAKHRQSN